ncbi:hypothetical protein L6R53_25000 [Myxococcota bacterium]|nr:hypothetical protein [Myxococcota bacterium]
MLLLLAALSACTSDPAPTDLDGDGHPSLAQGGADCDDRNPQVFPGAAESCNGVDDDCDGAADEPFDVDGDGYLADAPGCLAVAGVVDCDDGDAAVAPDAVETCNRRDDDCDGVVDEAPDADGDGVDACQDCDDDDPAAFPGRTETCDGLDNDCDGRADEDWDTDGDGWAECAGDCDEGQATTHPDATEVCDGLDNDCDGEVDEGFDQDGDGFETCRGDCDDDDPARYPWAEERCNGVDDDCDDAIDDAGDADGDGWSTCDDCDDGDPSIFPGAIELCDTKDTDCDGERLADELDVDGDGVPTCAGDCDDEDGARAPGLPEACDGQDNDCDEATGDDDDTDGDGLTPCTGDCDDGRADRYEGAVEVCDAVDNDCDGARDEGRVCGATCTVDDTDAHVYLYCTTALAWEDAQDACLARGYDLVALSSEEEQLAVSDLAYALYASSWWSGFNDIESEGDWAWSNGEPVTWTDWASGEPNDSSGEDCAQFLWSGYQWNDAACTTAQPYVCESLD